MIAMVLCSRPMVICTTVTMTPRKMAVAMTSRVLAVPGSRKIARHLLTQSLSKQVEQSQWIASASPTNTLLKSAHRHASTRVLQQLERADMGSKESAGRIPRIVPSITPYCSTPYALSVNGMLKRPRYSGENHGRMTAMKRGPRHANATKVQRPPKDAPKAIAMTPAIPSAVHRPAGDFIVPTSLASLRPTSPGETNKVFAQLGAHQPDTMQEHLSNEKSNNVYDDANDVSTPFVRERKATQQPWSSPKATSSSTIHCRTHYTPRWTDSEDVELLKLVTQYRQEQRSANLNSKFGRLGRDRWADIGRQVQERSSIRVPRTAAQCKARYLYLSGKAWKRAGSASTFCGIWTPDVCAKLERLVADMATDNAHIDWKEVKRRVTIVVPGSTMRAPSVAHYRRQWERLLVGGGTRSKAKVGFKTRMRAFSDLSLLHFMITARMDRR